MESERLRGLVEAARSGETAAFATLVAEHRAHLGLLLERMLGDRAEAEDVAQETLLRAYLGLTQLREPERFGSWLYGIALNVARMWLRRRAAYTRALARATAGATSSDVFEEQDVLDRVRRAVELLPPSERDVVLLHYVEGLSCAEIGALLDRSPGAVRVRLHRARARLREELAPLAPVQMPTAREEPMIEMTVDDVLVYVAEDDPGRPVTDQRIVVLRETDTERVLPIWIGAAEGNALAYRLRDEEPVRPMTADLLAEVVRATGSRVERVAVTTLRESTFYATVTLAVDGRVDELDARPSDALNLAVRVGAPIVVAEEVLAEVGVARTEIGREFAERAAKTKEALPPGEWRSLSAELLRALHAPPPRPTRP